MPTLLWDASALSKRYLSEKGSATVNSIFSIFTLLPTPSMVFTVTGYGEAYSILRRRFNAEILNAQDYAAARSLLRQEIIESLAFHLLPVEDQIFASLALIDRHNVNATDAAILAAYLDYSALLSSTELPCVLVASDHRMLRAARAEGLPGLDPETVAAADVPAFLNAL